MFTTWFIDYFKPTVGNCSEKKNSFNILLLIDIAPGHPRSLMEMSKEIHVVVMLANTSILQPRNQGVISTSKSYYLRNTFLKLITVIASYSSDGFGQNKSKIIWKGFTILDSFVFQEKGSVLYQIS